MRGDPKRLMTADQFETELVEDATRDLKARGFLVIEPRNVRSEYLIKLAESLRAKPGVMEADGLRDPDNPCGVFVLGEPLPSGRCTGDGHYLCRKCQHWTEEEPDD